MKNRKNLISILGPTAVGKTSFALKLARQALELVGKGEIGIKGEKLFSGVDLISADSRQVYKGLEILSGADVPESLPDKIRIHGVSILNLTDEWSVTHFKNFAINIIDNSFVNNRLPIIVGGTSLYIKHLFNRDDNLYVKPSEEIRAKASSMSVDELQKWLKSISDEKYSSMNNSDVNNPRRLVRAIEILLGEPEVEKIKNLPDGVSNLKIGLISDLDTISKKIEKRVVERFENGAIDEVKKLNKICGESNFQACTTLGSSDISSYLKKEIIKRQCLENWALHEFQYAKSQMTWLKQESGVIWLDDLAKSSYTLNNEKIFI